MTTLDFYNEVHDHGATLVRAHKVKKGRCSCGPTCRSPGKHPRGKNWQTAPGKSPGHVVAEWIPKGDNVSVVPHGQLFVVDVDPPAIPRLGELNLPPTKTVGTPRGGLHLYYRAPDSTPPPPNAAGTTALGTGVDIRSEGGQAIGPGSNGVQGPYTVEDDRRIAEAPPDLVERCRPVASKNGATPKAVDLGEWLEPHDEGDRNQTLARLVGSALGKGDSPDSARLKAHLWNVNQHTPLPDAEVDSVVDSIVKREASRSALKLLPCDVVRQHQHGRENPEYEWELADGTRISMGDAPSRVGASSIHTRLVPHGFVMSPNARKNWTSIQSALVGITEVHETTTEAETTGELIEAFMGRAHVQQVDNARDWLRDADSHALAHGCAVDKGGTLWVRLPAIVSWANNSTYGPVLSVETLAKRLSRMGFKKATRMRTADRKQTRIWHSPPGFASEYQQPYDDEDTPQSSPTRIRAFRRAEGKKRKAAS